MLPVHAIEAIVSLALLAALVCGPWQWICTDMARHKMFKSRDAIFDLARAGDLDFDSAAYQTIRAEINNMIRFAHVLSWTRVLAFFYLARKPQRAQPPIYSAIKSIASRDIRQKVEDHVRNIESAAATMVFFKSPLLMFLFVATIVPVVFCLIARQFVKDVVRELGGAIQLEAAHIRC